MDFEKALEELSEDNKQKALMYLSRVLEKDITSVAGWFAVSMSVNNAEHSIEALKRILKINPRNTYVQASIRRLESVTTDYNKYNTTDEIMDWLYLGHLAVTKRQKYICEQKVLFLKKKIAVVESQEDHKSYRDVYLNPYYNEAGTSAPIVDKHERQKNPPHIENRRKIARSRFLKPLNFLKRILLLLIYIIIPLQFEFQEKETWGETTLAVILIVFVATLVLITWVIEKKITVFWGWWYLIIPFTLIFINGEYKPIDLLWMVLLYLLMVNVFKDNHYWEYGVASIISVVIFILINLDLIQGVFIRNDVNPGQWVAIQSLISIGLIFSPRKWFFGVIGWGMSAAILYLTLLLYPQDSIGLYLVTGSLIFLWVLIRKRLRRYLINLLLVFLIPFGFIIISNSSLFIKELSNFIEISNQFGWLFAVLFAVPILATLYAEFSVRDKILDLIVQLLFFNGLQTAIALLVEVTNVTINSLITWLVFCLLQLIIQVAIVALIIVVIPILGDVARGKYTVVGLVIVAMLIIAGSILLYSKFPSNWFSRSLIISVISILLGISVTLLSRYSLNLGCGGLVFVVVILVIITGHVLKDPEISQGAWVYAITVLLGVSAWRSQRTWGIILTFSIMGFCMYYVISPINWLSSSSAIFLVLLFSLWVDKSNIPLHLKIGDKS